MTAENGNLEAVREWLTSEVKLQRYFDKLESHGFKTLETCSVIDENALDQLGINVPYHRKRLLMFSKSLREKLGTSLPNDTEDSVNMEERNHADDPETGNEQPSNLISFADEEESNSFPLYVNVNDETPGLNDQIPVLPPKKSAKPPAPPIPRRADLEPEDNKPSGGVDPPRSGLPGFPDLPKKAPPIKPPRKTPNRKLSQEKELEDLTNTDLQGGSSAHSSSDAGSGSSEGLASQPPAGDEKEDAIYVNAESALPDLPKRQSSEDIVKLSSTEEPDHKEQSLYGNVESEDSQHVVLPIEPTRTAPKPSSSVKRPIPKPRSRGKSEDGLEVTGLARKAPPVPSNRRPTSVSMPTKKQMVLPNGKPSTLPRYPQSEKRPPPTPPTRQSVTNAAPPTRPSVTNSDRGAGEAGFPSLPLPPFPAPNNDQTESAGEQQYETVGMPQQAAGEMYSFVGTHEHESKRSSVKSVAEEAIYEPVESKQEEQSEDDYDSDDCLGDDDMWMVESGKARGDSVDSTGSMSDIRASRVALSPRVRKSEGYLWKQGGLQGNKGWRKRWFVFDGKALTYYKDKDSLSESLHIIPVGQIKDIDNVKDTKRASFKVITPNRIFILASENITEMNLWSQTLMEAILVHKGDKDSWKKGGEMCDPDKEGWLKKQGHNVVADWKKRYLAVKEDKICYYDTYEDFQYATPINCINAAIAKVKTADGHRNRFLIITPNKSYSFQAESETEASLWIVAIETAIQKGLGDVEILDKVCENPSNRFCADCGSKDPVWASVNFCVCVCANCIGVHRNLGVHCSKPRSLLMDEKVWNPTLLELMLKIGNANANMLLEHKLPDDDKISHDADSSARREFIYSKYWEKKYCKYHQSFGDPDVLGKVLQDTVVTDDFMATLELILNKVDVRYVPPDSEDERTPLELAQEAGQTLQAELLRQNGGEGGKLDRQISYEDLTSAVSNEAALPTSPAEVVYEKEGFLYKKEGGWRKRWFQLKERDLKYTRGPHEKEELGTINLKTVTSLVKCPKGEPLLLDIVTVDKTHSLKADTDEELEAWYSALRSKQVFGVLLSQQELGSDGIPHLVAKCLQFVESYGGLEMEGVYRVNGGQLTMKKLITSFDQDASIVLLTLDECGVHDVTGVLKQYLRRLPDPVIPGDMYNAFIKAGMIPDHSIKLQTIKELVSSLPKVNHDTLKEIVFHLTKVVALVSVNKMGVPNIAMIFGPTLMSNEQTGRMDDASINLEFSMIGDMINYFQWLFDVKEEEVRKDQIMQDALQKIMRLQSETTQPTTATSEEFTLDIYVNQRHEDPCRVKVSADMTARMVCAKIVAQRSLPPDVNWALFEVIGHGAMERAFQVREKVMAAANWGSGNFLIVKENFIAEQIAPYVGTSLSIEGNLHIRDPRNKNWKQSSVCLKNGYMLVGKGKSFFKAIKSDKSETDQWPLHKLTLYLGVPAEKSTKGLDTSFGFTVVVKTDQEDITRYMCAKDKGDMHRWIASILNMKHPEGIWSDPSQTETPPVAPSAEPKGNLAEDMPIYLGRQSFSLRRKGSSKHIMEELRVKQKSLKRPVDRPFGRDPKGPS